MPQFTGSETSAFWVTAPGRAEIRAERLPTVGADDVLVRTLFSGVSRGTESLVFRGEVPPGEYHRMRAPFQSGEFPGPVKYGYASVGVVEEGPVDVLGRNVFCLFPHQDRYVVPRGAVHVIPDAVPPARAVLAANLETAINGIWDAAVQPGDRVAVVGAGVVGSLVAWLAKQIAGCEVVLVDINRARERVAQSLGVPFASTSGALAGGAQRADKVIHASGAPDGLALALKLAAFEATVVEMSWYGTRLVPLPLGESFHSLRLTLRSSQVGSIPASHRARWTCERRLALALELLVEPCLDALINSESAFAELPAFMPRLASGASDVLCHRLTY
jgi:NADPH:quinone reductase-like Zn-dependent oxidoreductase